MLLFSWVVSWMMVEVFVLVKVLVGIVNLVWFVVGRDWLVIGWLMISVVLLLLMLD